MEHLGSWTLTEVQIKGHVLHLSWLHGVVPGVWAVVGCSLGHTSMSRKFVTCSYAIGGGWLKSVATSIHVCRRIQFFRMILHTRIAKGLYRRLEISLSSAAVTRLGCNICCQGISLTKSRDFLIMLLVPIDKEVKSFYQPSLRNLHHPNTRWSLRNWETGKEMFYLMTYSTHFIYGYMTLDTW